tara:strand:+ start:2119 stop:2682 length:564 start_codon:yes stop_codon:yes gene_type:complete
MHSIKLTTVMNFNLIKLRLKVMFYLLVGKIGKSNSKIQIPNCEKFKKVILFFPINEESFRVSLYSFRKFNFHKNNITYYFVINEKFRDLINLNGPNLIFVKYHKNKMIFCNNSNKIDLCNNDNTIVVDLNMNFYLELSKFISFINSPFKIGFKKMYSDYFYNLQIDINKEGVEEKGFDQIQKILISK